MPKKSVGHFHTKIAGVTHGNRQKLIRSLRRFEQLTMEHDEKNKHDKNAIQLLNSNGQQLGFLNRELAEEVVTDIKSGKLFSCYVSEVTGGTGDKPTCGCNLLIVWAYPDTPQAEQENYCVSIGMPVIRTRARESMPVSTAGMKVYATQDSMSILDRVLMFFRGRGL